MGGELAGREGVGTVHACGYAQEAEIGQRAGVAEVAPMVLADVV
jgi:hypothetical protein